MKLDGSYESEILVCSNIKSSLLVKSIKHTGRETCNSDVLSVAAAVLFTLAADIKEVQVEAASCVDH